MFLDESGVEAIVPRRDRSMRRKYDLAGNLSGGVIEADAFIFHSAANCFEDGEPAVAFVHVVDARRDAHGAECANSPNSEQQLLADTHTPVSSIQPRRKLPVLGGVSIDI